MGSKTPGHPEYGHTVGVETTTGPLGQGFANAVGMAMAERRLAAEFNKPGFDLVDHFTYVYVGDGCLMEGVTAEAASLAGHLKLGRLICLYDDNEITIDGSTEVAFTEDVAQRFTAYGWHVQKVADGNDLTAIAEAIEQAQNELTRPSLIRVRTTIGYGSPNKQGQAAVHGAPLGSDEVRVTKENGWPGACILFPKKCGSIVPSWLHSRRQHIMPGATCLLATVKLILRTLNVGMNGIVQKSRPLWQKRKSYGSLTNQWPRGKHPVK